MFCRKSARFFSPFPVQSYLNLSSHFFRLLASVFFWCIHFFLRFRPISLRLSSQSLYYSYLSFWYIWNLSHFILYYTFFKSIILREFGCLPQLRRTISFNHPPYCYLSLRNIWKIMVIFLSSFSLRFPSLNDFIFFNTRRFSVPIFIVSRIKPSWHFVSSLFFVLWFICISFLHRFSPFYNHCQPFYTFLYHTQQNGTKPLRKSSESNDIFF